MTSELLSKLGLRIASVAAVGATGLALTASPVNASAVAHKTTAAAILHDYGTSLINPADSSIVADTNNNNNNNKPNLRSFSSKPTGLSDLA